jgi:hypothetical protein
MQLISKLWHLARADRSLLLKTVLWLGATTLGLWLLPLNVVRRLLAAYLPRRPGRAPLPTERIAWAVSVARHVVPRATCLPQALVTEAFLTQDGYRADLRMGVQKTDAGRLAAHAWVESGDRIVVGDLRELSLYTPLPPLPSIPR